MLLQMDAMRFADKLEWIKGETGWPIAEMARRAKIPASTIHTAVDEGRPMKVEAMKALAETLNVTLDWLGNDASGRDDLKPPYPWWFQRQAEDPSFEEGRRAVREADKAAHEEKTGHVRRRSRK